MTRYMIKDVTLLRPNLKTEETVSILVEDGIVTAMGQNLSLPAETEVIDASGKYATAGWIDAHAHMYNGTGGIGLDRDRFLRDGVTYVVEAGTTGPENFEDYLAHNSEVTGKIQGKAYLNLAPTGAIKGGSELLDLMKVDLKSCEDMIAKYPEEIIGVKLRIDPRVCENPWKAMELISELSKRVSRPLIVHASRTNMPMEDVLSYMKEGDIFAHTFADKTPGLLDENGNVKECAWEARRRGVKFDLSHGKSNFSFEVAKKAFAQGYLPDAVSTDLHAGSLDIVESLAMTMSKTLACGLDLWTVLNLVTTDAAKMLQITNKATDVAVGNVADITVFEVQDGEFELTDSDGKTETGKKLVVPYCTLLKQDIYWAEEG